jgi:hypothetical protein
MVRGTPLKISSRRHLALEKRDTWGISALDMIVITRWRDKLVETAGVWKTLRLALFSAQTRTEKDILLRRIVQCKRYLRACMEGVRNQLRITDPIPHPRQQRRLAVRGVWDSLSISARSSDSDILSTFSL